MDMRVRRTQSREVRKGMWVMLLAGMACALMGVVGARGDQRAQDAVETLTTGAWHVEGAEADHLMEFKEDGSFIQGMVDASGTFSQMDGYGGMWVVSGSGVTLNYWQWPTRHETYKLPIDPAGTHGVDEAGHAVSMTRRAAPAVAAAAPKGKRKRAGLTVTVGGPAGAAPTPEFPPELVARGKEMVKRYRNSIVFVTGSAGAGSGFIATDGMSNYLVTNVHVEEGLADAEFQALDGTVVKGGTAAMAVGEDLYRMKYPDGGRRFELMKDVDTNVSIGDEVVVLGNAEGAGVVNTLYGKVVGLGPNLVEVDAPFVPGNSGSPIVHLKTGKVIGVATYARFEGMAMFFGGSETVRRFGYRLDSVKTWQGVEPVEFRKEATLIGELEKRTDEIGQAFSSIGMEGGPVDAADLSDAITTWRKAAMAKKKNKSGKWVKNENGKKEAGRTLVAILHDACESDVTAAAGKFTYDYFKQEFGQIKTERDEMDKAVWDVVMER